MEGALYRKIDGVRAHLISLAGHLAAYTDYPEEDVPELSLEALASSLREDRKTLEELIRGYDTGAVLRRACRRPLGKPQCGQVHAFKSSVRV